MAAPAQIVPDVYLVTVGRGAAGSNVHLVRADPTWTLVDTASVFGPDARPTAILLTLIHPDHSGAAGTLARSWTVPVDVHADELPMAAGKYLPQYAMPLDRWLIDPLMRLLPARTRARAATSWG